MTKNIQQLYKFLTAALGSWRNTIYIHSQRVDRPGHLLAFGRDGLPVIMAADELREASGDQIDPAECCGQITEDSFRCLFAQYLLWQTSSPQDKPLDHLSQ